MNLPKHDPKLRPAVLAHSAKQHTIVYQKTMEVWQEVSLLQGQRSLVKFHIFGSSHKCLSSDLQHTFLAGRFISLQGNKNESRRPCRICRVHTKEGGRKTVAKRWAVQGEFSLFTQLLTGYTDQQSNFGSLVRPSSARQHQRPGASKG